jgi:hypothetical protein
VGTAVAVGSGVLGPIYPYGLLAVDDLVVVVGEARASFQWGDTTIDNGGFVLAIDSATGALLWHRTVGDAVYGVAASGGEIVIAGGFFREITLEPAVSAPIVLRARGPSPAIGSPTDGFVAMMSADGVYRWAQRFGSDGYDHVFGVAVGEDIILAGQIAGNADLGGGCAGELRTYPGSVDPEGYPVGARDAVLVRYDADGACEDGLVIGAPNADDYAHGVFVAGETIHVTGSGASPLRLRSLAGVETDLGGPEVARPSPWLLALGDGFAVESTAFVAGLGDGRAVVETAAETAWVLAAAGEADLVRSAEPPVRLSAGVNVVSERGIVNLGDGTRDARSVAAIGDRWVTAAIAFEPNSVVLARGTAGSWETASFGVVTIMSPVLAARADDLWLASYSGLPVRLGDPPVTVDLGGQGGFFLARIR